MKKIGIICAMQREAQQLEARLQTHNRVKVGPFEFIQGQLNGGEIILSQSGMGKVNAALNTLELIHHFHPDAVLNSGVAGGLNPNLKTMDSVVGTQYVYHDVWCGDGNAYGQVQDLPVFYETDPKLLAAARRMHEQNPHDVHLGLICTGDQFVSGAEPVAKILKHFPQGLACDMESAAIAQTCFRYRTPFLSLRLISDVAGKEETNMAQYENFWETMATTGFERTWALLNDLLTEWSA